MAGTHKDTGLPLTPAESCGLDEDRCWVDLPSARTTNQGAQFLGVPLEAPDPSTRRPLNARCIEKGCIFPASPGSSGICPYHNRERTEPTYFHSQQPSRLLLEWSKFGLADREVEDTRARDRRLFATLRKRFLEIV
jgi:hypothetical protein